MDGHIDINEITGPMRDAIERLATEIDQVSKQADTIEEQYRSEAAALLRQAGAESAPYRKLIADKQAAAERFRLLIAREEQEAAQASGSATETRMDPVLPSGAPPVDHNGEVPQP